jgi:hypothetical protein
MHTTYLYRVVKRNFFSFFFILLIPAAGMAQDWPQAFTIELEEVTYTEWPALQSAAAASHNGRWFLLGGRTGGLHGLFPPNTFPLDEANQAIHMLDPQTGAFWSRSVYELPDSIAVPLRATNAAHVHIGDYLYIMGGYGQDMDDSSMVTFNTLIAVDLAGLEPAMESEADIQPYFRMLRDSVFYQCGAEAEVMYHDGQPLVYLIGGHTFTGEYTQIGLGFEQHYRNNMQLFSIEDDGATLAITAPVTMEDSLLYHRRDFNVAPIISKKAANGEALVALSGVFQYDANLPWLNSFEIFKDADDSVRAVMAEMEHRFNNYTCPVMVMYDSLLQRNHLLLFGGISQFVYNTATASVVEDLNVPFTADISVVTRIDSAVDATTAYMQDLLPVRFEGLYGSNAAYFPAPDFPKYSNGVLKLPEARTPLLAGYLFGGIDPEIPNFGPSTATNTLYEVWLTYTAPIASLSDAAAEDVRIYPNPAQDFISVFVPGEGKVLLEWVNVVGETVQTETVFSGMAATIAVPDAAGVYLLQITDMAGAQRVLKKILVY